MKPENILLNLDFNQSYPNLAEQMLHNGHFLLADMSLVAVVNESLEYGTPGYVCHENTHDINFVCVIIYRF